MPHLLSMDGTQHFQTHVKYFFFSVLSSAQMSVLSLSALKFMIRLFLLRSHTSSTFHVTFAPEVACFGGTILFFYFAAATQP